MPPQPANSVAQTPSQPTPYGTYPQAALNYGSQYNTQQQQQPQQQPPPHLQAQQQPQQQPQQPQQQQQQQQQPYSYVGYSSGPMQQSYASSPTPPSMPPSAPTYSVPSPQVPTWQQSPPDFARATSQQSLAPSPGPIAGQWPNQAVSPPPPTPSAAPSSYGQPTLTSAQYPGQPTLAGAQYSPGITSNSVAANAPVSSGSPFPPFPGPPPPPAFLAQSPYAPPGTPQPTSWSSAQDSPPQPRSDAPQQPPSGATGHWEQDPGSKQWTWVMQLPQARPPPPPPPSQPASAPPPPTIAQHWVPDAGGNWTLQRDAPVPPAQYPFPPTPPTLPNPMQSAMMPDEQAYLPVQVTGPNGQRSYVQPTQMPQSAGSAPYTPSAPPYPAPPASVYSTPPPPSAYGATPPLDTRAPRPSAPSQYSSPTSTYRAPSRASTRAPPSSRHDDDEFSDDGRPGRAPPSRRDSAVAGMGRSGRRSRDEEARGRGTGRDDNRRRDRSASTGRDSSRSRSASRGRGSGDGRGVEYRSLSKGRNSRRNSASEAATRRALAA